MERGEQSVSIVDKGWEGGRRLAIYYKEGYSLIILISYNIDVWIDPQ